MEIRASLKTGTGSYQVAAGAKYDLEISIYDVITTWTGLFGGVSSSMVASTLDGAGEVGTILVRINSPGGDLYEGVAIYNLLKEHPAKVITRVDGLAASAASVIAMAGDEILMGGGTEMMLHDPLISVYADAEELRQYAAYLDKTTEGLIDIYEQRTGLGRDEIRQMLLDTTYMGADAAIEKGFATGKTSAAQDQLQRAEAWKNFDISMDAAAVAAMCERHTNRPDGAGVKPMFGLGKQKKKPDEVVEVETGNENTPPEGGADQLSLLSEMNEVAGSLALPLMQAGVTDTEKAKALIDKIEAGVQAELADFEATKAELADVKGKLDATQAKLIAALETKTEAVEQDQDEPEITVEDIRNNKKLGRGEQLAAAEALDKKRGA